MKTLLLATALSLITCLQRTCVFQILGKWYVNAVVSETCAPETQLSPILFSALSGGDVLASFTFRKNGQCHAAEITLEKTETPGKYRASWGRAHLFVEGTPVKDHLVFYSEGQFKRARFRKAKLVGRNPDMDLEALEAFKKFVQHKGLPQKDIVIPVQTGKGMSCILILRQ
uniref:Lipocalin/cytosolic fatty-acid binding domain-containing protein n=1 Tax=Ursus americanus TaxID=9643 RepID=A0A452QAL8_URSAM